MADEESTKTTEDTGLSEEVTTATDDDVSLEEDNTTFDDLDFSDSEEEEAATESDKEEPSEEVTEESEETEETTEEQSEVEEESEETKPADTKDTDVEAERKRFNDQMAKQRIAEREAREAARQAQQALEEERLQNYLAAAKDDDDELAIRQREVDNYKLQVERAEINAEKLELGIEKAITTIDLFRTGSDAVKKKLLDSLDTFEQMYVVKDAAGRPIEVKGDVYKHLVKEAESIRELTQEGAVQQAKTKEKAKARTITPPTRAPKEPKVDKDLDDFDKAWE